MPYYKDNKVPLMLGNSHIKKSDREDQTVPVSARETIKRQRERESHPWRARWE